MENARPKKAQQIVNVNSRPISSRGLAPRRPSWYAAGKPEVKSNPRLPAADAVDWHTLFSLGPKYPPPSQRGAAVEKGLRIENPANQW
jgi:hypothetical protein